jgi:hypothetical protein
VVSPFATELTKIFATMMQLSNVLDVRVIYIVIHALKRVWLEWFAYSGHSQPDTKTHRWERYRRKAQHA